METEVAMLSNRPVLPLYLRLYEDIKGRIVSGELPAGEKLPSIRTASRDLKVSINTVHNAYAQLEVEGYIKPVKKVGYFVEKIGDLIRLEQDMPPNAEKTASPRYRYDFSYSGVDDSLFPYSVWKKIFNRVFSFDRERLLSQGDPKGYLPLRECISAYLSHSRGIRSAPSNIIVSAGTEHLFYVLKRLLDDNTLYAFENPGYAFARPFFTYNLANPLFLNLDRQGIEIERIRDLNSVAVLVTPAHQFPMGTVMSISRRIDLLNWAGQKPERYVIEDDYDGEFRFRERPIPALKSMDTNDDVIYLGSFSRLIAPSLRVSYMILPERLMQKHELAFKGFGCPVSLFVQIALSRFMSEGYFEKHVNRMKSCYNKKYSRMKYLLERSGPIKISGANSGLSFVADIADVDEAAFLKRLEQSGVRITPISSFAVNGEDFKERYLLSFSKLDDAELEAGIRIMEAIIAELRVSRQKRGGDGP